MSDPATSILHDIVEQPQDSDVHLPRIRLGSFLGLLRVLAGGRGHAVITWNRYGFTHTVSVVRERADQDVVIDADPDTDSLSVVRQRLTEAVVSP